jgi:hypothetical protein
MQIINLDGLQNLRFALDDVIGYLTDNSCSDPDCCGGPFYELEEYESGLKILQHYGLKYEI